MEELYESIEREMTLISVIGLKEKLRKGAAKAVENFLCAGMKVWMITGDNEANAVTVANQVKLLSPEVPVVRFDHCDYDSVKLLIRQQLKNIKDILQPSNSGGQTATTTNVAA
jgi:magnesium-transporting ATPase (P-type)